MSEVILREQLLGSFHVLQSSFQDSLNDARQLDKEFQEIQKNFTVRMAEHIRQAKAHLPNENPMKNQMDGILAAINETDIAWQGNFASYDKGLSFRKDFQDSLLVFVFGKVKSGKSSLGNYMAWGNTEPKPDLKQLVQEALQPEYFTVANTKAENGDADDEAKNRKEFRVGATEATSSIQGFRLPGLTWVDSPGLHSVNEINGALAQEYVEHADLILYTMSSCSPGRASDLNEIKKIQDSSKEFLLLITGSDVIDEDEDEESGELIKRIIMKSPATRYQQREYISKELDGINVDDILSISARYAGEHLNETAEMQDSGMAQLFSRLHLISQNEGVKIKRAVPMKNFCTFLKKCREALLPYAKLTEDLDSKIADIEKSVPKVMKKYIREAQQEMQEIINNSFKNLECYRDDEQQMNRELRNSNRGWNKELQQLIGHALEQGLSELSSELKHAADKTWHNSSLEIPDFSIEKVIQRVPSGTSKGTKNRNTGIGGLSGSVLGGIGGFILGGPAGALAGASLFGGLGGVAGGAFGRDAQINEKTIELNIGDNLETLKKRLCDNYSSVVETVINAESNRVLVSALAVMRNLTREIATELRVVSENVHALSAIAEEKAGLQK